MVIKEVSFLKNILLIFVSLLISNCNEAHVIKELNEPQSVQDSSVSSNRLFNGLNKLGYKATLNKYQFKKSEGSTFSLINEITKIDLQGCIDTIIIYSVSSEKKIYLRKYDMKKNGCIRNTKNVVDSLYKVDSESNNLLFDLFHKSPKAYFYIGNSVYEFQGSHIYRKEFNELMNKIESFLNE